MKNTIITYTLLGIIILLIIYLFFILMTMPVWHVEARYDGFDGDACYGESDRLKQALSAQGIERITESEKPTSASRPGVQARPPVQEPPIRKSQQETGRE